MKKSKYFRIEELVPPAVFRAEGDGAWERLQDDLIDALDGVHDFLHEKLGTVVMTVNNWVWGGQYNESGYRVPETKTGAPGSMHKAGGAVDLKIKDHPAADIHKLIIDNQDDPRLQKISRMEASSATTTWCHLDVKALPMGKRRIHVFIP